MSKGADDVPSDMLTFRPKDGCLSRRWRKDAMAETSQQTYAQFLLQCSPCRLYGSIASCSGRLLREWLLTRFTVTDRPMPPAYPIRATNKRYRECGALWGNAFVCSGAALRVGVVRRLCAHAAQRRAAKRVRYSWVECGQGS